MEVTEHILEELPLFRGLSSDRLARIAEKASHQQFVPGALIFREGDDANTCYVIRNGIVALQLHSPERGWVTVQTLRERDVLGLSWMFPPRHWMFDARALEITRVIAVDAAHLRDLCEADHDLGYELMKRFTQSFGQRLQATRMQLLDLYGTTHRKSGL